MKRIVRIITHKFVFLIPLTCGLKTQNIENHFGVYIVKIDMEKNYERKIHSEKEKENISCVCKMRNQI